MLDLAANADVFTKQTCDTTIDLSPDPVGLVVRQAIFAPGDAHCCPSSMKISVLTFDDASGWTVLRRPNNRPDPSSGLPFDVAADAGYIQSLG